MKEKSKSENRYDAYQLKRIHTKLVNDFTQGSPREYEVRVDGLDVIPRTNDPERFLQLERFVDLDHTRKVDVIIFRGQSHYCDLHTLTVDGPKPTSANNGLGVIPGMGTMDIQKRIREEVKRERKEWEHERLQEKHRELKAELKDLEEYADKLEEEVKVYRKKKLHLGNVNLAELGGIFLEGFIRRNPQMLAKLPGGESLAGLIEEDNAQKALEMGTPQSAGDDPKASFEPVGETTTELTPQDQTYLELLRRIESSFTRSDFLNVMAILDGFTQRPDTISDVMELMELSVPETQNHSTEEPQPDIYHEDI